MKPLLDQLKYRPSKKYKDKLLISFNFNILLLSIISIAEISSKLIGVVQINRHGARTGDGFEKLTSKYYCKTKTKQLTINGISQHEVLGNYIADRYIYNEDMDMNILNRDFQESEFKIFSSSVQRAIFSGFGFLKGLYPNSKFKLNFIGKLNITDSKNYSNLVSSDVLTNISLPFEYESRRKIPEIPYNVLDTETDTLFSSGSCRIKISEIQGKSIFSNETVKEFIKMENEKNNYTGPLNFEKDEIDNCIAEIKQKFPIAFIEKLLKKEKGKNKKNLSQIFFEELNEKKASGNNETKKMKFLVKVNSFLRFAQFHFGDKFVKLTKESQRTLNKIQLNKSYIYLLSKSPFQNLLNSRFFDETKSFLLDYLKNFLQGRQHRLKYVVYSGHDKNILGILANFLDRKWLNNQFNDLDNKYDFLQPSLASNFLIELHVNKKKLSSAIYVKFIYNGVELKEGFNNDYFSYNKELGGFEFKNFLRILDNLVNPWYSSMNCQSDDEDDD